MTAIGRRRARPASRGSRFPRGRWVGRPKSARVRRPSRSECRGPRAGSRVWSKALWNVTWSGLARATSAAVCSRSIGRLGSQNAQDDSGGPECLGNFDVVPHDGQFRFRIDEVARPRSDQDMDGNAQPAADSAIVPALGWSLPQPGCRTARRDRPRRPRPRWPTRRPPRRSRPAHVRHLMVSPESLPWRRSIPYCFDATRSKSRGNLHL